MTAPIVPLRPRRSQEVYVLTVDGREIQFDAHAVDAAGGHVSLLDGRIALVRWREAA